MYPSALVSRPHRITDVDVVPAPLNLPRQQAVLDDADGEFVEATLLRMLQHEENINGFQSLSTMSQVLSGNEHGPPPVISGSHLQNLRPPNYVWDPDDEEKDRVASDDEYFDPEALLRELAPSTEVSPRGLHQDQVLIQPPPSGKSVFHSPPPNYVWDPDDEEKDRVASDDDYFDPEALLRELAPSTEVSPRGSHQDQVLIQPPPSGSLGGSSSSNNTLTILVTIANYYDHKTK